MKSMLKNQIVNLHIKSIDSSTEQYVYIEREKKIWEATKIKIHTNFVLQETKPVFGRWFSTWPHPLCHHHMHTQGPISECLGWRSRSGVPGAQRQIVWNIINANMKGSWQANYIHSFRSNNEVNRWKYWHSRTSNNAQTI